MQLPISIINSLFLMLLLFGSAGGVVASDQYSHGMHVVITGTGTGPMTFQLGGSGVAIVIDGKVLQFDAGPKTREHLFLSNVLPEHKIDYLFFTHLHADHTSDFVDMNAWPGSTFNKGYKIFGPVSTKAMTKAASDFIQAHDDDGRAMVTKAPYMAQIIKESQKLLIHDVEEMPPSGGLVLNVEGIKVTAIAVPHMMAKDGHSYAYRVDSSYGSVVISGDTGPSLNVVKLAKNADLLIHEATHYEPSMRPELYEKWSQIKLGDPVENYKTNNQLGHSTPEEVGKVAQRANVKKLVTYHMRQFTSVPDEQKRLSNFGLPKHLISIEMKNEFIFVIKKHYQGPVVMGEPLMVFEIGESQELDE